MTIDSNETEVIVEPAAPLVGANSVRAPGSALDASISPTSNLATKMNTTVAAQKSRVPGWIGFPLAVIISFASSAGLYSYVPEIAGYELATVSRSLNEPWQIGGLLLWKLAEISIAWFFGLDCE